MCEQPFGEAETTSSMNDNCRRRERCLALVFSTAQNRIGQKNYCDRLVTVSPPDLVIAEIANAAWKFVIFDRMAAVLAAVAVREIVKAFEELAPAKRNFRSG
jgi:hypothetical protein